MGDLTLDRMNGSRGYKSSGSFSWAAVILLAILLFSLGATGYMWYMGRANHPQVAEVKPEACPSQPQDLITDQIYKKAETPKQHLYAGHTLESVLTGEKGRIRILVRTDEGVHRIYELKEGNPVEMKEVLILYEHPKK